MRMIVVFRDFRDCCGWLHAIAHSNDSNNNNNDKPKNEMRMRGTELRALWMYLA